MLCTRSFIKRINLLFSNALLWLYDNSVWNSPDYGSGIFDRVLQENQGGNSFGAEPLITLEQKYRLQYNFMV
ncbi:hypothetical protein OWV82_008572 [Melia azedarach]|uniref:Uncharacterized protein n=1 Tax=Melia azedarach TaxID=155640 RepID=A0ACC1YBM2_MELAZ|nr:hypothetical protein OWV82_008572 [Melia azedarach]